MKNLLLISVTFIAQIGGPVGLPAKVGQLGSKTAGPREAYHLDLPSVPPGCALRVFYIPPDAYPAAPRESTDWGEYLSVQGVSFPKGGFAAYFAPSSTLVVATIPEQLQRIDDAGSKPDPEEGLRQAQRVLDSLLKEQLADCLSIGRKDVAVILEQGQKAWEKYRDLETALEMGGVLNLENDGRREYHASVLLRLTNERIETLRRTSEPPIP